MDYKEKYEQALEKARQLCAYPTSKPFISDLQDLFPELAESEDERIRKELIAEVKEQIDCIPAPDCRDKEDEKALKQLNKWLAWLEKQGEQNLVKANEEWYDFIRWFVKERTDNYTLIPSDDDIHKWGDMILNHAQKIFENQGEQKEYNVCDTCDEKASCVNPCHTKLVEQNSAWSEEDEKNINFLCELLTDLQVKSTENEIKYGTNSHSEYYYNIKKWLKSLKERYTWKPSDEQMEALESATENCAYSEYQDCLRELIKQLKKLREE